MSNRAKLIEETKKELLSLLVCLGATKNGPGIPVKQFYNDYRSQIGMPIPYKELGYATVEDFFHEIPDTVSLTFGRDGAILKAVDNEAISHIVNLVDSQKTTVVSTRLKKAKKTGRGGYRGGSSYGGRGGGRGGGSGFACSLRGGYSSRPSFPKSQSRYPSSTSASQNRYGLSAYAPSQNRYNPNSNPPTSRYFQETTSRKTGSAWEETAPKKTGFSDIAPRFSNQSKSGGFVPPPEKPKPSMARKPTPVTDPQPTPPSVPALTRGMIRELLTAYPNGIYGSNVDLAFSRRYGQTLNPCKLGFKNMYMMFATLQDILELEEMDDDFRIKQNLQPISTRRQYNDNPNECGDASPEPQSPRIPVPEKRSRVDYVHDEDALKEDIKKVLGRHLRTGLWASEFPKYFQDVIGIEMPLKQLGYPSVIDLMGEVSDIVVIERASPSDWKLYDKEFLDANKKAPEPKPAPVSAAPKQVSRAITRQSSSPQVSDSLRESVRQVVCTHAEGLPFYELPDTYKAMVGKPLPIQEIGFPSLDALVQQLVAINVITYDYIGEGLVLLKAVDRTPATTFLLKRPGLGETRYSVPADAVGQDVAYPRLPYPKLGNEPYEVFVCQVNTPVHFWFQLKGNNTTLELEYLMDELEDVYKGPYSDKYLMPESMITPNQLAAALFPQDDNWHRVNIIQRTGPDFVQVYFTDYGGSCSVHKDNLRLLKRRFLQHPAQALPGKFAYLEAPESGWKPAGTHRMLELTSGLTLLAYLVDVDKDQVISMCLCDTNGEQDIHIQDTLVEEGHARFAQDAGVENAGPAPTEAPVYTAPEVQPQEQTQEVEETVVETPAPIETQDNIAYVSPMQRRGNEPELDDDDVIVDDNMPTCVKLVELVDGYSAHIINYEGRPYIISSEISAFFWDKDLLRSMLRQKQIDIPRKGFSQEEYADLFNEFEYYGISGVTDRNGQQKTHITVYSLESIPRILDEFGHTSEELRAAIRRESANFNPDDPYWKGENDSDVTSDSGSFTYETSELNVALKTLQYRRKNIVDKMTDSVTDAAEMQKNVEELGEIESKIARVQSLMKDAEKREVKTDDDFIQQCISRQYSTNNVAQSASNIAAPLPTASFTTSGATSATTPATNPYLSTMAPGFPAGLMGNNTNSFSGIPTATSTSNPLDMSSLMSSLLPMDMTGANTMGTNTMGANTMGTNPMGANTMGGMSMMGAANPMAGMPGMGANLTPAQQQFMLQYNMMLSQQMMMGTNPMMNMNMNMGMPGYGFPGASMMNTTTQAASQGLNAGQMSMADMSMLVLGQGRGVPSHLQGAQQSQSMPRPGGLQK